MWWTSWSQQNSSRLMSLSLLLLLSLLLSLSLLLLLSLLLFLSFCCHCCCCCYCRCCCHCRYCCFCRFVVTVIVVVTVVIVVSVVLLSLSLLLLLSLYVVNLLILFPADWGSRRRVSQIHPPECHWGKLSKGTSELLFQFNDCHLCLFKGCCVVVFTVRYQRGAHVQVDMSWSSSWLQLWRWRPWSVITMGITNNITDWLGSFNLQKLKRLLTHRLMMMMTTTMMMVDSGNVKTTKQEKIQIKCLIP